MIETVAAEVSDWWKKFARAIAYFFTATPARLNWLLIPLSGDSETDC